MLLLKYTSTDTYIWVQIWKGHVNFRTSCKFKAKIASWQNYN